MNYIKWFVIYLLILVSVNVVTRLLGGLDLSGIFTRDMPIFVAIAFALTYAVHGLKK